MQQVFLAVFRGLPSFRGESAFSTWLYRIIVHVAYEHLRKRRRRALDVGLGDLELSDPSLSPEGAAREKEELARALGFLARLHPKKRIAFVLRTVEGLSLEEIGAIVGANAPAVGQRVKHAQRELAEMIARDEKRRARMEGSR
jgi:RNA polymerase sigma-70 factor (ECF subfamily)